MNPLARRPSAAFTVTARLASSTRLYTAFFSPTNIGRVPDVAGRSLPLLGTREHNSNLTPVFGQGEENYSPLSMSS